jgi:UDPglucose 6-dehydrogenase
VADNVAAGRLNFTTEMSAAVAQADAVFIAVGTPSRRGDGFADLSYVYAAAEQIAQSLDGYTVVVTKSTVPVGTGREVERIIRQARPGVDVDVVSNPEFLREGGAIADFKQPDRVVIGANTQRARDMMEELYRPLSINGAPLLFTNRATSELTKYASNAFLATKITFINEMADLCERVGANVEDVARGIGLDKRIGMKFLQPGPGYGGSCFPKDTVALVRTAQQAGAPTRIVESVVTINDDRKKAMAQKILDALGEPAGKRVAVLGLTFKPNTDDMRESPSLDILPMLKEAGVTVTAHDPEGVEEALALMPDFAYVDNPYDAMVEADAVALITEWDIYRALDMDRVKATMRGDLFVDLRNVYRPGDMVRRGFRYVSVGRPERLVE